MAELIKVLLTISDTYVIDCEQLFAGENFDAVSITNNYENFVQALFSEMVKILGKNEDDISMEMCSPGIERTLRNAAEFEIFTGREVRVWDKNVNDWVCGKIKSSDKNQVTLELEGGGEESVAYADIAKAKFLHL